MVATDNTISSAPARIVSVTFSPRISQPRNTAITGFTYAYVDTFEIGACWSSQTYAVNAISEPTTTREAKASSESDEKPPRSADLASPRASPAITEVTPPASIWIAVEWNGSEGSGSRGERNEPSAQHGPAKSTAR